MDFREWLHLSEMAHLRVPSSLELTTPCLNRMGRECQIAWVDMKFEDPPQIRDQQGKVLNSGSNFVFKNPQNELYYVVQQGQMLPASISRDQATELVRKQGFTLVPNGWWLRAQAFDPQGEIIATKPVAE